MIIYVLILLKCMITKSFLVKSKEWEGIRKIAYLESTSCSKVIRASIKDYLRKKNVC